MSRPRGPVTLSDVAREAGVSVATASRALNGSTRTVGPALVARVTTAARLLQYAPNAQAQAMATGATNVVGLLVHDIADPYFSAIASGVSRAADEAGLLVMLSTTMGRPNDEVRYLRALRAQRGRAVILAGSRRVDGDYGTLATEIKAFERAGGKVVAISQARLPVDTIVVENGSGAATLATELVRLGYTRFGMLAGPQEVLTARERSRGFARGLAESGCPAPTVAHGDFTRDGGYAAMSRLLDQAQLECVFAVNDVMALGAMTACRDRGLAVPDDLAIAGYDDISPLRDVWPPLTSVRLPLVEMGARAMDMVSRASGKTPRRSRVRGRVVLRASTPPRS